MSLTQIVKRDGTTVPFNETKISTAIEKALASVGMKSDRLMKLVTHDVLTALKDHEGIPTVEQVQDIVERMLTKRGLYAAAKSFILYRAQHEKMRDGKELMMDISGLINAYRDQSDWRVHENANSGYSYSSLLKHVSSSVMAKYGLMELYPPEIARHHIDGDFHIHDLQCSIIPYCAGHSLRDLLLKGFKGTPDKNTAGPAKHLAPALQQAANFLATLQTEWAGAQAFSSFDTYMAPFVKVDKEYFAKRGFANWGYTEVKQALQMFLYVINVASRWGECVPTSYKALKADGTWASCDELTFGDEIVVFDTTHGRFATDRLTRVNTYEGDWTMYAFASMDENYTFECTAQHRVMYNEGSNKEPQWVLEKAKDLVEDLAEDEAQWIGMPVMHDLHLGSLPAVVPCQLTSVYSNHGTVWCPTTDTGTFVCKTDDGSVFVTGNSPFTNITMDLVCPPDMKDQPVIIGGEYVDGLHYGDCQEEMNMLNKAFIELMMAGDYEGKPFSFPIPTYNITSEFDWESDLSRDLFALTGKYGIPYFQNFIGSDISPQDTRSMCPMDGVTPVWVKDESGVHCMMIENAYARKQGEVFRTLLPDGRWAPARVNKQEPTDVVVVELSNGETKILGINHLQPVVSQNGNISTMLASELLPGMCIPYSTAAIDAEGEGKCYSVEVKEIQRVKNTKPLYCFEVDTDDHLFVLPGGMVTHNCRLRIDLRELLRKTGALFGSGEKTGSIGVVTLNMPRLGYLHQGNEKTFFAALEQLMDDARDSLEIKRKVVERSLNNGLMPYSKEYIGSFDNHFSTIGLVGMNECCLNFMGVNIADPKGKDFAVRVLKFMRDRLSFYQEETKHLYNLEATPAEGTCYRLARADKKAYPDIITAGGDGEPYYTNSTHLPVGYTDDVFKALDHQEELQTIYTGGTVVHVFLGEGIQDPMQCMKLVRKIAETYKIPAFTITPTYSVCPEHGYIKGEHKRCPKCVEVEVSGEEIIKQMKEEGR